MTKKTPSTVKPHPAAKLESVSRRPRLPWLHKKRYYIPLLTIAIVGMLISLSLPFLPQVQSVAQDTTANNSVLAKVVPPSFRPPDVELPTDGSWLVIPAAGIKLPIVEGTDIAVLNKEIGVWHQVGDISGNYVVAGHRLQYHRTVNQSLYNLDRLKTGDSGIYIILDGVRHEYKVQESKIVDKYSVEILDPTAEPRLTIYTCNDFFNQRRLTIVATPL